MVEVISEQNAEYNGEGTASSLAHIECPMSGI